MQALMLLWLMLIAMFLLFCGRRRRLSPLLLGYVASLSLIHVPGAINYLPGDSLLSGREETELGFLATLLGLAALLVGSLLTNVRFRSTGRAQGLRNVVSVAGSNGRVPYDNRALGVMMIVVGFIAYFVAMPIASRFPSMTALVSPMGGLLIVGVWLYAYDVANKRDWNRLLLLLLLLPLLPASTLLLGGFIGYGIGWMLCILAVIYCFWPRRTLFLILAPLLAYGALSFAAAYFQERDDIREVVWGERAALQDRISTAMRILDTFEPYDVYNIEHVSPIDERLNQNHLVGLGILSHQEGLAELYYGRTVPVWALVPRVLWPEKPEIGGGLELVSEFTGLAFSEGTSVGTGHVLELYMNFGWAGIVFGFLALGMLLARLDRILVSGLASQELRLILVPGLVGLSLLAAGGNIMEALVASVGSVVTGTALASAMSAYVVRNSARFEVRRSPQSPSRHVGAS